MIYLPFEQMQNQWKVGDLWQEENKAVEDLIARILEYINEKQVEETNEWNDT